MKSIFKVNSWNEEFVVDKKLAHAKVEYDISGDLRGSINVDYSILYINYDEVDVHKSTSMYNGFMVFHGLYEGVESSFCLEDKGGFINNEYVASVSIIEGSGTGRLENVSGSGSYVPSNEGMLLELNID